MLNATYDDEANIITRHGALHMGMATQTPNGLMVAVIRNAESRACGTCARDRAPRRSCAHRQGGARGAHRLFDHPVLPRPDGRHHFDPGHQPPEVAIIAVNKVEEKLVVVDGEIEVSKRMNLSLSVRSPRRRRLGRGELHAGPQRLIENPLRLLSA